MSLVFQGKLNFLGYAIDDNIVIILPEGRNRGGKAIACWQWTVDGAGRPKQNVRYVGNIDSLEGAADMSSNIVMFQKEYYNFSGKISSTGTTLELTMAHGTTEKSKPVILELIFSG